MKSILYFLLLMSASAQADQTSDFLAANDAFRAGDTVKLERYAQRLKKSPLEVYVSYYRLHIGLVKADAKSVQAFLSRPEDTPLKDLLRADWLKLLGSRQQWALFDAEYPRLIKQDAELICYALQSRHRDEDLVALSEARLVWFSGKGQPDSCGVLFDDALSAAIISEPDIKLRLRLALEAGNVSLALGLAERLADSNAEWSGTMFSAALKSAAADADRYLGKLSKNQPGNQPVNQLSEPQRAITLFALLRLAKQSPELSAARWAKISTLFSEEEQLYYYGWLAYEAARNLDGRALQWYQAAADTPLNEQQLAWRVRAALRVQDWAEVLSGVQAMGEQQRQDATWQYWKARALQALGSVTEARDIFVRLSGAYSFYGQLAAEELAGAPLLSEVVPSYKPDEQAIAAMISVPGIQRTLALYRMGLRNEALEEWRWVLRNFNDRELLTAAEIARRNEMYDRAIGAADKTITVHDFSMRYLAPYRDALHTHIREHGLDEAWVYGLMRQESRFVTGAKSNVGAAGLMQVMPATARWIAGKLGLKNYRNALIHQLDTNLRLGTYYMKTVLSQSDNSPVLASASYNAGPTRARQWRGDRPLEGAIYTETIPYQETRDYVQKVMSNTYYYALQFGDPPRTLKQRLGVVPAKTTDNNPAEIPPTLQNDP